jgi:hypothetical protein
MLRTLFRFTSQIEGRSQNQVGVRLPHLIFGVESFQIHLGGGNGLLPGGHALAQLDEFYLSHY